MPEDPGFNGNRWMNEASKLLVKMGWDKIGDSNIDVEGSDGHKHGLDSIFRYEVLPESGWEGFFIEAKYYSKNSFNLGKLQDWVKTINQKILDIRRSEDLYRRFPVLKEENVKVRNGMLAIWIHDLNGNDDFSKDFRSAMRSLNTPHGRGLVGRINRLFIFNNQSILKICSLIDTVSGYLNETNIPQSQFNYWYPATKLLPAMSSTTITIEYALSKIVFGKIKNSNSYKGEKNLVFYFGPRDYDSYDKLRNALSLYQFIDNQVPLVIFNYQDDEEFRKIKPDVEKLFHSDGIPAVELRSMIRYSNLPPWMTDETR